MPKYFKNKLDKKYIFNIVYDSEKRITPQRSVIMLFDTHLKIKFTKHKNKILDYYSICKWYCDYKYNTIIIQYKSRKDNSDRELTFSPYNSTIDELSDALLDHCQFIADISESREEK